jgi:hypothetical protein
MICELQLRSFVYAEFCVALGPSLLFILLGLLFFLF